MSDKPIGATTTEPDSGYLRLEQQIRWYDSKSGQAQRNYKWVKIAEYIAGVLIPVLAPFYGIVTAVIGGVAVVLEGLQQISQWQHNWITYRSTCEALRHEKYTYLAGAGPYEELDTDRARRVLVERVEALVSTEHAKWISRQEYHRTRENQAIEKPRDMHA